MWYFVPFIDANSGFIGVEVIKTRDSVAGCFKNFEKWFNRRFKHPIETLYSDNGGEYQALGTCLKDNGIEWEPTAPYTPEAVHTAAALYKMVVLSSKRQRKPHEIPTEEQPNV